VKVLKISSYNFFALTNTNTANQYPDLIKVFLKHWKSGIHVVETLDVLDTNPSISIRIGSFLTSFTGKSVYTKKKQKKAW